MAENSAIAWTDHTWNPWQGCHKVSPACDHCYMYREKKQYGQDPTLVVRSKPPTFNAPLKWKDPARVFTCSWSDFFIEEADPWRYEAWDVIRRTPHLTYLILTKRIDRADMCVPADWPFPNVWLGVTVEDQERADERIPALLDMPAAKRFVSCEPMLEPVDLATYFRCPWCGYTEKDMREQGDHQLCGHPRYILDWVICGCESGPHHRPSAIDDFRALRDQCVDANVPLFLKQMEQDGRLVKMPLLDGRQWAEVPNGQV